MKARIAVSAALLGCLAAYAGEIVIVQPAAEKDARSVREPTRSERELGRTTGKARGYAGTGGTTVIVGEGTSRAAENAEHSIQDAQDYLRPGGGAAGSSGTGGTTVILRATPQSDTEKLRQKARSYVAENPARSGKVCEVANTVGTVGDGGSADRGSSVIEKGNSAVIVNCR